MTTKERAEFEIRVAKLVSRIKRLQAERDDLASKLMEFTRYSADRRQAHAQRLETHMSIFGGNYATKCDND